jgi:hypothetical protein
MKNITIYDPAMCCSTGVCGTEVDPRLIQFASDLAWLKEQGASVERFNLAQQPAAFAANPQVREALASHGNDALPLVLVDGVIATRSIYPTRDQLLALAAEKAESGECCGDEFDCCGEAEPSSGCCDGGGSSCC